MPEHKTFMTEDNQNKHDDIICDCSGTTFQKVQQLIDDGADTLDKVSRVTGACSGCSSCDILVLELLEDAGYSN